MEKETTGSMAYIEVKTLEIGGFASAFQALRLPFGKECRSEAFSEQTCTLGEIDNEVKYTASVFVNTQDLHLMSVLVKRGDEHAKVVRGIMVYAEINAPRYWWQEMDTYRIGTDRLSSESTMHIQGKGMSEEELLHVTEPFYRTDKSRSRAEGGAGLGLALCQQIIQIHGWQMQFESQIGDGTKITLTFTTRQ